MVKSSNSYLSCEFMIAHLDSLIGIIEPEMQDQIDTWGGTYNEWMDNVNYMKEFMNDRCTFLNAAIVDCYDVEGPFNVNVVINGIGEVDFNNFFDVNESNTPFNGEFFGGIDIDFSVTKVAISLIMKLLVMIIIIIMKPIRISH